MAENQNAAEQASTLNDERATRLAKRAALFEAGQNPYPSTPRSRTTLPTSRPNMPILPMARIPRTS